MKAEGRPAAKGRHAVPAEARRMTAAPLTCLFCNAEVPLAPGLPKGHKVTCPRCGETFPLRQPSADVQPAPGVVTAPAATLPALAAPAVAARPLRSVVGANRRVAALVVGVMLLMAATGLTYALMTQDFRRANDSGLIKRRGYRPTRPDHEANAEAALASPLGYLPPETNAIVWVHAAELRASPAGRRLLEGALPVGGRPLPLGEARAWTGLGVEQIDQVVLGLKADDNLAPPLTLVVRTRQKYDSQEVVRALEAQRRDLPGDSREVYRFTIPNAPLPVRQALLWFADDRTLVVRLLAPLRGVGLGQGQGQVPVQPVAGFGHLGEGVRDLIARAGPSPPLGAVAQVADWSQGAPVFLAGQLKLAPEDLERLQQVRAFALSLRPEKQVQLVGAVEAADAAAAAALEKRYLAPHKGAAGLTFGRDKDWLTLRWTGDAAALGKALSR
jgi:hypothetical protein